MSATPRFQRAADRRITSELLPGGWSVMVDGRALGYPWSDEDTVREVCEEMRHTYVLGALDALDDEQESEESEQADLPEDDEYIEPSEVGSHYGER